MARVNHKKVKQLINEKRSKISDRQFFTSRILALHFEDMWQTCSRELPPPFHEGCYLSGPQYR